MPALFTDAWAQAWGDALNASASYRQAARGWDGTLVLEALANSAHGLVHDAAVYLELADGCCRTSRRATADDRAQASFVITGPLLVWLDVLNGELAPAMAIVRGKLTLDQGSLFGLLPHMHAASALLRVAQSVDRHEV